MKLGPQGGPAAGQSWKPPLNTARLTSDDPLNGLLQVLLPDKRTQVAGGDQGRFVANVRNIST